MADKTKVFKRDKNVDYMNQMLPVKTVLISFKGYTDWRKRRYILLYRWFYER